MSDGVVKAMCAWRERERERERESRTRGEKAVRFVWLSLSSVPERYRRSTCVSCAREMCVCVPASISHLRKTSHRAYLTSPRLSVFVSDHSLHLSPSLYTYTQSHTHTITHLHTAPERLMELARGTAKSGDSKPIWQKVKEMTEKKQDESGR